MTDPIEHNRESWNQQSTGSDSPWCEPVDAATIAAAGDLFGTGSAEAAAVAASWGAVNVY